MSERKVMIIGLDGATMNVLQPLADKGELPHIAEFIQRGACGPLRSVVPPVSPAAWSTFATGMNPGGHGILNFYQAYSDSYAPRFVNAAARRGTAFWELAGRRGIRHGIVNVPVTYPPRTENGFVISGMLSPGLGRAMASPPELYDELLALSPDYRVDVDMKSAPTHTPEAFLDIAMSCIEARLKAGLGLYRNHRPPLMCVVFTAVDRVNHYFWGYMEAAERGDKVPGRLADAIPAVYRRLDDAVGVLVAEAGGDTDVLLMSDHGSGGYLGGLDLGRVLEREGLLVERKAGLLSALKRRLVWTLATHLPPRLKGWLKGRFPGRVAQAAEAARCVQVDWSRSQAYPSGLDQGIFVNLKGRQEQGIVESGAAYEAARDRIAKAFMGLRDPAGRPVVRAVHMREDIWHGPMTENLPDLVLEQIEFEYRVLNFSRSSTSGVFFDLPPLRTDKLAVSGGHRLDGIFLARGPHVKPRILDGACIADVPATVMALLECPIPDNFDGRVLREILTDDVQVPQTVRADDSMAKGGADVFSESDEAAVQNRLKDLGYM